MRNPWKAIKWWWYKRQVKADETTLKTIDHQGYVFSAYGNHKGHYCVFQDGPATCQEGVCANCEIWQGRQP